MKGIIKLFLHIWTQKCIIIKVRKSNKNNKKKSTMLYINDFAIRYIKVHCSEQYRLKNPLLYVSIKFSIS